MPLAAATTLRGALHVLGKDDDAWLETVDRLLGRMSAPSVLGLYGWLDGKVPALVQDALHTVVSQLPARHGLARREAVFAVHTVLVVASFFEVVREALGEVRDQGDWQHEDHEFVLRLYSDDVPAPSVVRFADTVADVARWAADRGERVHRALGAVGEMLLESAFVHTVVTRYQAGYRALAADVPEFRMWANPESAVASPSAGDDGYVPPRCRTTRASQVTKLADERWWASLDVRPCDVIQLLVSHLTTAEAGRWPMLVAGAPGSGKSVLAKALAARLPGDEFVVLHVPLRQADPDAPLVEQIDHGDRGLVVVLDGLEDLPSGNHLDEIVRYQQRETAQGRLVAVVVTCRTSFLDQVLVPYGTPVVQLAELSDAQVAQWVEAWNRANTAPWRRPMTVDAALAHPELARNPWLLSVLTLQLTDPALPRPSGPLSPTELLQRAATVPEHSMPAIAALGMFNRGGRPISEEELRADLTALGHHELGDAGSVLRDLESQPATFGEYLIAAVVMQELADRARGDDQLFALLSHRPLAHRPSILTFVTQLAGESDGLMRAATARLLDDLLRQDRTRHHAPRALAAYTANLVLLRLFLQPADGSTRIDRELADELLDLWRTGLDPGGLSAVLALIEFDEGFVRRPDREAAPRAQLDPDAPPLGLDVFHAWSQGSREISEVAWSADNELLTVTTAGHVTCWRLSDAGPPERVGDVRHVTDLAWNPARPIAAVVQRLRRATDPETGHRVLLDGFRTGTRRELRVVDGTTRVCWSPDGDRLALLSNTRLWTVDVATGDEQEIAAFHPLEITKVSKPRWSGTYVWTTTTGVVQMYDTADPSERDVTYFLDPEPLDVFFSAGSRGLAAIASADRTGIEIRPLGEIRPPATLEGHTKRVVCAKFSPDGLYLASMSLDDTVRIWRCADWQCVAVLHRENVSPHGGLAFHPVKPLLALKNGNWLDVVRLDYPTLGSVGAAASSRKYANAKVVLVGDTGVGKSGLGLVLSGQPFEPTESTHGRNVWTFEKSIATTPSGEVQTRETLLWDLAGQPGYRMVHQLHLNEVAVALVVFDARSETDPFAGVQYWSRALNQARRLDGAAAVRLKAFLVAARTDRGGTAVSTARIQQTVAALGFDGYVETSAKEGWGVDELVRTVRDAVDWDAVPAVSSTALFQAIKDFVLEEKKQGRVLATVDDLRHSFRRMRADEAADEELEDGFAACLGRLESVGVIRRMAFGDHVLIRPELLDSYASSLVQAARDEPDGLGFVPETDALTGRFRMPESERLANAQQERILLIAVVEELLRREIALKEITDREVDLIFPSQFTRERPDAPELPGQDVVFTFDGHLPSIYATLAVRLSHSRLFRRGPMYHNSASYLAQAGGTCGIAVREIEEGKGELTLCYDETAAPIVRRQFEAYVVEHLAQRAVGVVLRRVRKCRSCGYTIPDELVQGRLGRGATSIRCPLCEDSVVPLVDGDQPDVRPAVAEMNSHANARRDLDVAATTLKGKHEAGDYDVFLSHNVKDKPQVLKIAKELEARGILPWLDVHAIQPGSRWQREMANGIERSRAAAVLIGPHGPGTWHEAEMELINDWSARNRNRRVIPVILDGTEGDPVLPGFLRVWATVDMRMPDPDPIEQLVWGITGEQPPWA